MLGHKILVRYSLILIAIAFTVNLSAQVNLDSPYSRYAIGEMYQSTDPLIISMGGLSMAYRSPYIINYANPASYTAFDSLSFIFQGAINSNFTTLDNGESTAKTNYTSLSYLIFGFPVTRWWRTSVGILPYSKVGYDIRADEFDEEVGNIQYIYDGSGGVNRVYWGSGFRINEHFSVGFNLSYLFGKIEKSRAVTFPDSVYRYSFKVANNTNVGDVLIDYGMQYTGKLNNGLILEGGLVFANSLKVRTKESQLSATYISTSSGSEYIKDTIESYPENVGNIVLPTSFGLGLILRKDDKWLVGVDYYWQNWNNYTSFGKKDSLDNSMQISIGTQFTPDKSSISKYWKRMSYRFGLKFAKSYIEINDEQLKKFGISFGLGLPLRRSNTKMNFAFEFGQIGTTNKNLIKENYVQISFGLTIYERWFFKKKYE